MRLVARDDTIGLQHRIAGLYAITPDTQSTGNLSNLVDAVLAGGCRLIQYRNKQAGVALAREQAAALRALTTGYGAKLIINDHLWLALEVRADGVHLGKEDADTTGILSARKDSSHLDDFSIGASCYNSLPRADQAVASGVDYVAFGSIFGSSTKPSASIADISLLSAAKQRLSVPVVAIGGISTQNARQVVASGADAIAVISDLFGAGTLDQITARARLFNSYFPDHV